ncbi:aspartyl/asparaginyl beta-hydroxylase-like isoform X2 [Anopheles moucheti]|uniref:aspartyl/asparaginyl beta-hydroxylase-like isoform X2 n=1 Tax=Anopheles moucheti TaxID=186751 RepID=UPI0022F000A6|nr:aspartyl/asparaginyl beta-hydroxylase-like isoform X2 [Anopheles moucheti]
MSGDTQPKKRKDKKRKKDDEDTVKETTVHGPKQPSAGAAQAAKEPGDIQMHIHSDHGTGGHWCAKVVFFVLLAGLGALIGLILMESQGVSNDDTPLSESRYSEFFNGWVDETRQDDHHHDEILAAINSLDDHDDDGGDDHHAVDDHDDDDGHDQEDDHDDGAPYAEEEDHDDDEDGTDVQDDDDEDEGPAQKLDDDEVEDIFIQQEAAAQQQAAAAAEDDGDDDDDGQDDENDDDDDAEPVVKTNAAAGNTNAKDDNDDDGDDVNDIADDDDDQDDTPFDEEQSNALNDSTNQKMQTLENSSTNEDTLQSSVQNSRTDDREPEQNQVQPSPTTPSTEEAVTGDILKDQMDELVRNYNKLAESLNVPKVNEVPDDTHETVMQDGDDDGDEAEIEEVTRGSQTANDDDDDDGDDDDNAVNEDDDDKVAFGEFVDNDGGEEEYLEKVRAEQQRRAAEEARRAAAEPVEESSQIPSRAEEADRSYQEELRRAEQQLDENKPQEALAIFDRIILRKPNIIAALVGRARCLDALAEQRRSNTVLTEAITAYRKVLDQELAVDDATLKTVAERCIDRMRFQGQHAKAIEVHKVLIRRFDNEPQYRNQLAVSYLYMNRLAEAKAVLHETLLRWIDDGFALVHYGFVLKTLDQNMELAAQYLQEGIDTDHPGTQDGRFYFQLGDALQRLGRNREALDVYRKGVQKKLFLSLYQRSLYNIDGLRSRPFWTEEQTTYATELELLRAQWKEVRDEGLKLLNSAGVFVNESENLRDRGDWKQLELFSRGSRLERNCARAPLTCRLVEQYFPAARTCKRGQVKFSVMHPGTHVWPHCGPTNCRIRAHLGLSIPQGTYIRVAEETRSWENGKWLIFDDSFEHEVWHNGTETRLVLIVDFWHPDLTESQRRSLSPI